MRSLSAAALTAIIVLVLSSCSSEDDDTAPAKDGETPTAPASSAATSATPTSGPASPTAPPQPSGPTLAVTVDGDDVGPNATELTVAAGEPLLITVTASRPGELHVHSKPEQFVEFAKGVTTYELVVDVPGQVEIEEHDTSVVVAQVQVTG
ncbi:hypothetical protein [Nocardioides sp.]|uniref:hypothetical protein n=1 Tax=Nocardioides sp. TaxID=35761 RepID=UPI0027342D17|nr:hypothetical protein [Nocardioides sp.]MDP3891222.1 hypothetical protein [Nocardioides sp.]